MNRKWRVISLLLAAVASGAVVAGVLVFDDPDAMGNNWWLTFLVLTALFYFGPLNQLRR